MVNFYLELEHTQQVGCLQRIVCALASYQKLKRWQHERTRTRTDVFSNFHAASGGDMVKFIPNSLSFAFTVWMHESGYYVSAKKDCIVMKRSNDVAKISMVETDMGFAMNDVCQKRFLSFCRAWLNRDKSYIDQLHMRGVTKLKNLSYQMVAA